MAHWARPGVKCVCIEGGPWFGGRTEDGPEKGEVCTITEVSGGGWLTLAEYDSNDGFAVCCFRPLVSQEDDVALFTHHLITEGIDA